MPKHLDRAILLEACVENADQALKAATLGANQIELCSALHLDGLTPDLNDFLVCRDKLTIPIKVMIRPKPGDFTVDEDTLMQMEKEIDLFKENGADHFVFGITDKNGELDLPSIRQLLESCQDLHVTIHKAIDTCQDPVKEAKKLMGLKNVSAILTSGGKSTAIEGAATISEMIREVGENITVIAAGSITNSNLHFIHELIGADYYHGRRIVGPLID